MPQYLVGIGHDLALIDLDPIVPQPRSPEGVQTAQRDVAADGTIHEQGLYIVLQWSSIRTATIYQTLLTQLSLDTFQRAAVTIYAPDFKRTWHRYNGYIARPPTVNYTTFYRGVQMIVNRLVALD